ncbi:MAG: 3-phosphoserine/phosphohydroxythreonine transaminase [Burkholderiales bacterium]|jgi:phosphoserine aminotransferase|nr:3-phosphoserine/phosphohydroxythreonine transaminase [Burkholderiales bacterium]
MSRAYNFGAGPAMLPEEVLQIAKSQMLEFDDTGTSIMEIGHRTTIFQDMLARLEVKLRNLIGIPADYKVLFLPGGGQGQFSLIPMNLTKYNKKVDYFVTGIWSERAAKFAARYATVNIVARATLSSIPDAASWNLQNDAAYAYYCPNETINGVAFPQIPDCGNVPLIADATSSILFEKIDVTKFGVIFAAAQKNLGIAGITLLIIREDLLDNMQDETPEVFNYTIQAREHSCLNTIPTFQVYMMDLMVDWMIKQGGQEAITEINKRKVCKLYNCIDNSNGFYVNNIEKIYRSPINVPFNLPNDKLLNLFLDEAAKVGLRYLNGHKLVGGARASLYNAMPEAGVDKLIDFMQNFAKINR